MWFCDIHADFICRFMPTMLLARCLETSPDCLNTFVSLAEKPTSIQDIAKQAVLRLLEVRKTIHFSMDRFWVGIEGECSVIYHLLQDVTHEIALELGVSSAVFALTRILRLFTTRISGYSASEDTQTLSASGMCVTALSRCFKLTRVLSERHSSADWSRLCFV